MSLPICSFARVTAIFFFYCVYPEGAARALAFVFIAQRDS